MARRAWKLPVEVIEGHRIPVCHIKPARAGRATEYHLVIEGNVMSYAGPRRQMMAVADYISLNWFELRRLIGRGPDPEWLEKLIVRKVVRGSGGDDE